MGMSESLTGVTISLVANLLINVGLNIQKIAHDRQTEAREGREVKGEGARDSRSPGSHHSTGADTDAFCSFRWVAGLIIQLTGESGNMVAYSFAATSIIAPLGAVGLVANLVIATVSLNLRNCLHHTHTFVANQSLPCTCLICVAVKCHHHDILTSPRSSLRTRAMAVCSCLYQSLLLHVLTHSLVVNRCFWVSRFVGETWLGHCLRAVVQRW